MILRMMRIVLFKKLFLEDPSYRLEQIQRVLFDVGAKGWQDATALPQVMRKTLEKEVPWMSVKEFKTFESARKDTFKAVMETEEGKRFETVLMENTRGQWTICVSSQIGCAMRCSFCATGTMGLTRSLSEDEIVDQYRFWKYFLHARPDLPQRISNVVFMGMGEPLANYTAVKGAIRTWLTYTDIGPTHITVSTVGLINQLEKLIHDPDFPSVRIAVSLHSAIAETRKEIVPTTMPEFLEKLADWAHRYLEERGNRRHYLTFEYIMLDGVNDTDAHARALGKFAQSVGHAKVNVIPYNTVVGKEFAATKNERLERFKDIVRRSGIDVTQRKTMGDDIAAACGQLIIAQ